MVFNEYVTKRPAIAIFATALDGGRLSKGKGVYSGTQTSTKNSRNYGGTDMSLYLSEEQRATLERTSMGKEVLQQLQKTEEKYSELLKYGKSNQQGWMGRPASSRLQ